jgi:uncharacterized protein DUF5658
MEDRTLARAAAGALVAMLTMVVPASAGSTQLMQVAPLVADGLTAQFTRAHAAAAPVIDTPPKRPSLLIPMYVAFGALQAADAHSSYRAFGQGLREVNPVMGSVVRSPGRLAAVKVATTACTVLASEMLWRRHPRAAVIAMAVLTSGYGFVVSHNYRELH